jgi:hypothetical protein
MTTNNDEQKAKPLDRGSTPSIRLMRVSISVIYRVVNTINRCFQPDKTLVNVGNHDFILADAFLILRYLFVQPL